MFGTAGQSKTSLSLSLYMGQDVSGSGNNSTKPDPLYPYMERYWPITDTQIV